MMNNTGILTNQLPNGLTQVQQIFPSPVFQKTEDLSGKSPDEVFQHYSQLYSEAKSTHLSLSIVNQQLAGALVEKRNAENRSNAIFDCLNEIGNMKRDLIDLKSKNDNLELKYQETKKENDLLKQSMKETMEKNQSLEQRIKEVEEKNGKLEFKVEELLMKNISLEKNMADQVDYITNTLLPMLQTK